MIRFLFYDILLSSLGWLWILMGISTHRTCKKVRERERARATAKVVDLIPERRRIRSNRRHRGRITTVWHPVVEFAVENQRYRLQSPANLLQNDLSVGQDVDICYDADDPARFHFEEYLEHDIRTANGFIAFGILWAFIISPFLVNKALNG